MYLCETNQSCNKFFAPPKYAAGNVPGNGIYAYFINSSQMDYK